MNQWPPTALIIGSDDHHIRLAAHLHHTVAQITADTGAPSGQIPTGTPFYTLTACTNYLHAAEKVALTDANSQQYYNTCGKWTE